MSQQEGGDISGPILQEALRRAGTVQGGRYLDLYKELKPKEKRETGVEFAKMRGLGESGLRTLGQVKSLYEKDPTVLTKQKIPGKFFSRDFDNSLFNTVDTLLRLRTGAAAPESEVRRYMASLGPNFGDSPQVVEQKLNNLAADLSAAAGQAPSQVSVSPVPQGSMQGAGELLDFLIPGSKARTRQISSALETGDVGGAANVAFNPLASPENIQAATSVAGYAFLPKVLQKVAGKTVGPLFTNILGGGGKKLAEIAAKSRPINTKAVIAAGDEFITNEPAAKALWNTVRPTISEATKPSKLLAKMFDVWKGAYSATGKVKDSAEAKLYNKLYGAARNVIAEQAPELSKQIGLLRLQHITPKIAQKFTWLLAKLKFLGL